MATSCWRRISTFSRPAGFRGLRRELRKAAANRYTSPLTPSPSRELPDKPSHLKTLGRRDIVLFTVSAILLLDTLAAGATLGPPAVTWWLALGILFFVPYALICAELGTAWAEQGGLYAWIREAFGRRWASRATWAYWVNTAVWIPAILILFAGIFAQLFAPGMTLATQIALAIALTWLTVAVNVVTLDVGKWIPNAGALLKLLIIGCLVAGAFVYAAEHGMANPLTIDSMTPAWNESLRYFSVIIYGMLGFELVSAGADEMKDPARDVPFGILASGLVIILTYTLATVAILAALPAGEIDLVEGLVDTLRLLFGETGAGGAFAVALGIGALYTFFANGVTWSLGCNRAMAQAAREREFPALLGREHPDKRTPVGAAVMMGAVSTVALLAYGFIAPTDEDLFWSLFAFSAVVFLVPYILLVFAFLRLRQSAPERPRPYRLPGGPVVAAACAWVCGLMLGGAMLLFAYTPGEGMQWPVAIGALTVMAIGEGVIRVAERSRVVRG